MPLIQNLDVNVHKPQIEDRSNTTSSTQLTSTDDFAKWAVSISLSITVTCQTGIALLSRSLDRQGSLKISNRYVRPLPRILVVVVVVFLPIDRNLEASTFLSIVVSLLLVCLFWELIVSLERDGGVFEP